MPEPRVIKKLIPLVTLGMLAGKGHASEPTDLPTNGHTIEYHDPNLDHDTADQISSAEETKMTEAIEKYIETDCVNTPPLPGLPEKGQSPAAWLLLFETWLAFWATKGSSFFTREALGGARAADVKFWKKIPKTLRHIMFAGADRMHHVHWMALGAGISFIGLEQGVVPENVFWQLIALATGVSMEDLSHHADFFQSIGQIEAKQGVTQTKLHGTLVKMFPALMARLTKKQTAAQ